MTHPVGPTLYPASPQELARLERAHHEIRTALTIVATNVELVRLHLRQVHEPTRGAILGDLSEVDLALDRLQRLAVEMRGWHAPPW